MLITTCPICLRHRPQRPPPCHPPPSLILASTYEIDASPPSYSHLIMPCRHFRRVHITFSTTTAIYTCSTHRRATCCHAIYAVTMPFHSIDCCCHNDSDAALTPPPQPHIRPSILVPSPFDPKSTRTQSMHPPNVPSRPSPGIAFHNMASSPPPLAPSTCRIA